jgi:hypothetical protein
LRRRRKKPENSLFDGKIVRPVNKYSVKSGRFRCREQNQPIFAPNVARTV